MEGSSEYKLLYHDLVSKFLNKLLNLAQDVVLSLKQVLNLLDSPVPQTFRYSFVFCIFFTVSFSSFNEFHQKVLSTHLRSSFQAHLHQTLSQLPSLWQKLGQKVVFEPRLLRFTHEVITVGTNLRNHRVVFVSVMLLNSLLDLVNCSLGLSELDDSRSVKSAAPVASSSNTLVGDTDVSEEIAVSVF